MKYIIVGGGPTGLAVAYILAKNNVEVELIEQNEQLGGSWNSQWVDKEYWSENAPRVLSYSKNTKKFLNEIGITKNDLGSIYGNFFETNYKIIKFVTENFSIADYIIFLNGIIKYNIVNEKKTLYEWLEKSNLSEKAKNAITIISITICDVPNKTNVNDFFCSLGATGEFKQFTDANKWHNILEEKMCKMKDIKIRKNTIVNKLIEKNNKIIGIVCKDLVTGMSKQILGNKIVLCTQSNGILNIIKNSNNKVKNNWKPYEEMNIWCKSTYYSGFSFQLHFSEEVIFPKQWCWSCKSEWSIIILPISNWVTEFTKNPNVKTVWSCCIIDMETKSKYLEKAPNECSKDEIVHESLRQIRIKENIPQPYHITTSVGLKKQGKTWVSSNTGFTRGKMDYLPMKGKIDNLFALGCFTRSDRPSISYMETAISSVVKYMLTYEKDMEGFHKPKNNIVKIIILIILSNILAKKIKSNI
tara:strand:- start:16618 stop:18030 length:1413 start_codon:yes stop_codon:yes gene_type:complete